MTVKPDHKYSRRRLLLFLSLLLTMACAVYTADSAPSKRPASFKTVGLLTPTPVVFGVTGASPRETALLVPGNLQAAPYDWDLVPSNDTSIQVLRSCDYYTTVLGIPSLSANHWWCWDQTQRTLIAFSGATAFADVAHSHPDWIWMIANEPDRDDQDHLSPEAYAEFFGAVATRVANALRTDNPSAVPQLVFCQVSSPDQKSYCEQAYFILQQSIQGGHWPDWPSDLHAADVIHAISVHNYVLTDPACQPAGPVCFGSPLEESRLEQTMAAWSGAMDAFARWADSVDGGALADKPLWLTEFGALWAFCPGVLEFRIGIDPMGGVACPDAAKRGDGKIADDFVFYGRNEREGIWGAQRLALNYLLNPGGDPSANRGDWAAAWWFTGRMEWLDRNECKQTVWLFGDNTDCSRNFRRVSRAGQTFRNTISCLAYGRRCA
jgi:hypothetical protein